MTIQGNAKIRCDCFETWSGQRGDLLSCQSQIFVYIDLFIYFISYHLKVHRQNEKKRTRTLLISQGTFSIFIKYKYTPANRTNTHAFYGGVVRGFQVLLPCRWGFSALLKDILLRHLIHRITFCYGLCWFAVHQVYCNNVSLFKMHTNLIYIIHTSRR